jgi:transposase-like protein
MKVVEKQAVGEVIEGLGETEGARRATGVSPAGAPAVVPDPAVEAKASRRRFTAEYKLRILREVDRVKEPGDVGAILRREGLYSSHLTQWRQQRDRVAKAGLAARKRGPKARPVDPRLKQMEREIARLKRRNRQVEIMLEIQKKASELLGIPLNRPDSDEND